MKKINYVFLALLFLGFMTLASCKNTAKKTDTTTPVEEVIEEETEAVEEETDSTNMEEMTEEEVEVEEEQPAMGE